MVKSATTQKKTTDTQKEENKTAKKTVKKIPASSKVNFETKISNLPPINFELLVKIWLNGWKSTFNLKGRCSLFELWTFMLLNSVISIALQLCCNFVLSENFLRLATIHQIPLERIDTYLISATIGLYIALLLPLLPLGTLLIRRMHDLGELAWNKYMEPLFMGVVVLCFINISLEQLQNEDSVYTYILLSTCFITILYSVGFYGLKFLIKTLFYIGDTNDNKYGKASFQAPQYTESALNFSCLYFLLLITVGLLYLSLYFVY